MPNPLLPSWAQIREGFIKATGVVDTHTPRLPPLQDVEGEPIPEPLDPLTEGRQAYNPYRGTENHGVENPDGRLIPDAEGYGPGTVDVVYDETPKGGTVLDVRVISDAAEQLKAWRTLQLIVPAAGNPPQQVASRMRNRTTLKVENMSATDDVWVGPDPQLSAFNGYRIKAGADLTIGTTEAVYGMSNTASPVAVCVVFEFTQEA